jgi:hypothetical protein
MTRTAPRAMDDGQRTWLRRLASVASVVVLVFALYQALPKQASCPQPEHPKPGVGYACDPSGQSYHHPAVWLSVAALSVATLIAVRRLLSDEAS